MTGFGFVYGLDDLMAPVETFIAIVVPTYLVACVLARAAAARRRGGLPLATLREASRSPRSRDR